MIVGFHAEKPAIHYIEIKLIIIFGKCVDIVKAQGLRMDDEHLRSGDIFDPGLDPRLGEILIKDQFQEIPQE